MIARTLVLAIRLSFGTEVDAMTRMWIRLSLMICACVFATSFQAHMGVSTARAESHSPALPNVINDWALIAQNTIAPTVVGSGQNAYGAMVPIAMYDAVVAIEEIGRAHV